ncbi:MAG TPA: hypothetical protein VGO89_02775 [Streptomyces sp.]|jgi:hypothetical protein|nr:hypothetical protein [Streptomyces sp.]
MPRWAHRLWAAVAGYRWLRCLMCDRQFGTHEGPLAAVPFVDGGTWAGLRLVCRRCSTELLLRTW